MRTIIIIITSIFCKLSSPSGFQTKPNLKSYKEKPLSSFKGSKYITIPLFLNASLRRHIKHVTSRNTDPVLRGHSVDGREGGPQNTVEI
jgi:hypothetical protein